MWSPYEAESRNLCRSERGTGRSREKKLSGFGRLAGVSHQEGFSLLELLVVMSLLAVLAVIGLGTFSNPKKSMEWSRAGETLENLSVLARQHALSKNTRTALVFTEVMDGNVQRVAVSIWDATTTNQLEKWNLLPESVEVVDASVGAAPSLTGIRYRGQSVVNPATFLFYPDGRMSDNPADVPKLVAQARHGSSSNAYELIFNSATGTFVAQRP